ncbi:MAG: sensor domain-containing diguanylate cyclase [Nitrospirota bacterium]
MKIYTLKKGSSDKFLRRLMSKGSRGAAPRLDDVLREILAKADEFVPSEAGSILLDDPHIKSEYINDPSRNLLHFVACFGPDAEKLVGLTIPASYGIAGKTYLTGRSYKNDNVKSDNSLYNGMDKSPEMEPRSIICVPIVLGRSVCGVIEMINRNGHKEYSEEDLKLLEIFAGYTSTLIQNALDANRNEELTRRDDLTGLYNDRYFHKHLTEELKRAKRLGRDISLLFLDLDNFKSINDTFGHLAGSRTLAEVGAVLYAVLKDYSASIVRYGGDEFSVILPGRSRREALVLAEKVRKAVEEAVFLKERSARGEPAYRISGLITCSIGVSSFFEDGIEGGTPDEEKISFIRHADRAMYRAKERGKNTVCTPADEKRLKRLARARG